MAQVVNYDLNEQMVTEIGTAEWAHLIVADTKFKAEGEYKVNLKLDAESAHNLIRRLEILGDKAYAFFSEEAEKEAAAKSKKAKPLNRCPSTPWEENEDGTVTFKFKRAASKMNDDGSVKEFTVALLDSTGHVIPQNQRELFSRMGNGSKIRVKFTAIPFNTAMLGVGVSLRLEKVQVVEFVEYVPGGGFDSDFGAVEGGFVLQGDASFQAPAAQQQAPAESDADLVV